MRSCSCYIFIRSEIGVWVCVSGSHTCADVHTHMHVRHSSSGSAAALDELMLTEIQF